MSDVMRYEVGLNIIFIYINMMLNLSKKVIFESYNFKN